MMDEKDKCLNVKNKCFYMITRENVTKNIYIYIYTYYYKYK